MKFAATIFALAGCVYLALGVAFWLSNGFRIGSVLMVALVVGALFSQSYSLFRAKHRARQFGLISSAVLAACFLGVAAVFISVASPMKVSDFPADALSVLMLVAGTTLAFGLAFFFLLVDKHAP